MRTLWLYFLGLLFLSSVTLFFFFNTDRGHKTMGYLIEDYLSKETYNEIKVYSLNLDSYPHIIVNLQLNHTANITLKGEISNYDINMSYHLKGESLHFNDFYLNDKIDVHGELVGKFSSLSVKGKGNIFDGSIEYSFIKIPHGIRDMLLNLKEVESQKVFDFLEEPSSIHGLANIDSNFSYFSPHLKNGESRISIPKLFIPQLKVETPFVVTSTVNFRGVQYQYQADIDSNIGHIILKNGYYHDGKKITKGDYQLDIEDFSYLKKLLNYQYRGDLDINGEFFYDISRDKLELKGETNQFGGKLSYLYKDDDLELKLKGLSLEYILKHFSYPVLFLSNINGVVDFKLKDKMIIINTDLNNTRFIHSELSELIYNKASVDILKDVYNKSTFLGGYQNGIFSSTLKIDNGKNHIYLTDTLFNLNDNKLKSKFEMRMDNQEVFGEIDALLIDGVLQNSKFSIDKERLIEFQAKKYFKSWF